MSAAIKCIACGADGVRPFMEMERAPVFCNQLCHTRQEALDAPVAPITLGYCGGCGHVFNVRFDSKLLEYNPEYENSLHFSAHFQQYADKLVKELRATYDLDGKTVVELGCGGGAFLRSLCVGAGATGYGFDPSYPGETAEHDGVRIVRESYFDAADVPPVDLFCCRHVIEHVDSPIEFMASIVKKLGADSGASAYLEVPNALYTLRDGGIWDIIYEHPSYFSPTSFRRMARAAGFSTVDVAETFSGQFLSLHAELSGSAKVNADSNSVLQQVSELVDQFAAGYRQKVSQWKGRLDKWRGAGQRVVVWGAGSKGNSFLNVVPGADHVAQIVDINPSKHGKFVAGMGQEIVAPDSLKATPPDVVVLMNPVYVDEVRAMLAELGLQPELLCA